MDIATVIGVLFGFACIGIAVLSGGSPAVLFNQPAVVVTGGGVRAAPQINFSLGPGLGIHTRVKKTVFYKLPTAQELIQKMVDYTAINRRDGALALEKQVPNAGEPFLVKALQMVIDGQSEQDVDRQLSIEIQYLQERHRTGKKILEFMGASAPAFGMIGTLIGLVQMLQSLEDPSQIGFGMATALITTFYGALLANVVFIPLAGKLGIRSKSETLLREMIVEGILGIVRGESPTAVRERMQAFISAKNREDLRPRV